MPFAGHKILIADPSSAVRGKLTQFIAHTYPSLELVEAENADQCRTALSDTNIGLALIEPACSSNSGMDMLQHGQTVNRSCLIVLIAEAFSRDLLEAAKMLKAYDCLEKPLREDNLSPIFDRFIAQLAMQSILIVDSNVKMRKVIAKVMQASRFQLSISEADSVDLAISLSKTIPFNFVFMDVSASDFEGMKSISRIQRLRHQCQIVLIGVPEGSALRSKADAVGIAGFLNKPFYPADIDVLLHNLQGLTERNLDSTSFLARFEEAEPAQQDDADVVLL